MTIADARCARRTMGNICRLLSVATLAVALGTPPSSAAAAVAVAVVTSNPQPTAGGAAFSYTVTITNGASIASNVVVNDPLPPNVVFYNLAIVGGAAFSCTGPAFGTNGTVACTSPSFAASGVATLTIVAGISADTASGVRTNSVRVTSGGAEATASVQQNLQVSAPLYLSVAAPVIVIATNNVVYDIVVDNQGSSSALNVNVIDVLPANTSFVGASATGPFHDDCHFDPIGNQLVCHAQAVPIGTHHINLIVRTAKKPRTGVIDNEVTLQPGTGTAVGAPAVASTTLVKK